MTNAKKNNSKTRRQRRLDEKQRRAARQGYPRVLTVSQAQGVVNEAGQRAAQNVLVQYDKPPAGVIVAPGHVEVGSDPARVTREGLARACAVTAATTAELMINLLGIQVVEDGPLTGVVVDVEGGAVEAADGSTVIIDPADADEPEADPLEAKVAEDNAVVGDPS